MNLQVSFDLNGEPAWQCRARGHQVATLFLFVMQACLESLEKAMSTNTKPKFRTKTRTECRNGGHVPGTD